MPERGDSNPAEPIVECSVLVPVLNEERHVCSTVEAMQRQRFPGEVEFLFVDGGSEDRTRALLERLAETDPRIRILSNPRRGTPSSLNLALSRARGRWVARMDGHTEYPPDYLTLGVERLQRGGTRWVSGPQVPKGTNTFSRAVALALSGWIGRGGSRKWGTGPAGDEYELDSGVFAGVWERETITSAGGWDESWLRNQDSEMAGRFLARGERLVCVPGMAALYAPRDTLRGLWRQYLEYGEYRTKTGIRHPHTLRRSHLLPPTLVLTLVAAVLGPAGLRGAARKGVAAYATAVAAAGIDALRYTHDPEEALLVPVVLMTMHLGHGVGMIRGVQRHGFPAAALAAMVGLVVPTTDFDPAQVYAPSLREAPPEQRHAPLTAS